MTAVGDKVVGPSNRSFLANPIPAVLSLGRRSDFPSGCLITPKSVSGGRAPPGALQGGVVVSFRIGESLYDDLHKAAGRATKLGRRHDRGQCLPWFGPDRP